MAFDAGAIVARLEVNKSGWDNAINKVNKDLGSLSSKITASAEKFRQMGKMMTVAGGMIVGTFGMMIKKTVKMGDEIQKLSVATGISADILSGYRLAVEHSGSSMSEFSMGLKRISKMMVDADRGLEQAERTFRELGISVRNSDGSLKSIDQMIKEVADKFSKMEDGTKKAALAQELFGRAGMKLIPMLNLGSEGLKKEREEAEKLGIVFSDKTANASAYLNDRLTDLKMSVNGLMIAIGKELLPAMSDLITKATSVISKLSEWAKEHPVLSGAIIKTTMAIGGLMTVLGPLLMMLPGLTIAIPKIVSGFVLLKGGMVALSGKISGLIASLGGLTTILPVVGAALAGLGIGALIRKIKGVDEAVQGFWTKMMQLTGTLPKAKSELSEYTKENSRYIEIIRKIGRELGTNTNNLKINALAIAKSREEYEKLPEKAKKIVDRFVEWDKVQRRLGESAKETAKKEVGFTEKVMSIVEKAVWRFKELTLDKYEYQKQKLIAEYNKQKEILEKEGANAEAFFILKRTLNEELKALERDRVEEEKRKIEELNEKRKAAAEEEKARMEAELERKRMIAEEYYGFMEMLEEKRQEIRLQEIEEKDGDLAADLMRIDIWYNKQKEAIYKKFTDRELIANAEKELEITKEAMIDQVKEQYDKKDIERKRKNLLFYFNFTSNIISKLSSLFNMYYQNRMSELDNEYKQRKKWIEENIKDETKRNQMLQELEDEFSNKKREAAREAAKWQKASALVGAIVNTAEAVTKALAQGGPIAGPIMAAIVGALGAVQIALIASQPIPMAEGGLVESEGLALLHPGEVVMPYEKVEEMFGEEGNENRTVVIEQINISALNTEGLKDLVVNDLAPILQDAMKDEVLLVHPKSVREY